MGLHYAQISFLKWFSIEGEQIEEVWTRVVQVKYNIDTIQTTIIDEIIGKSNFVIV